MNRIEKSSRNRMMRRLKRRNKQEPAVYYKPHPDTQEPTPYANRALRHRRYRKEKKMAQISTAAVENE